MGMRDFNAIRSAASAAGAPYEDADFGADSSTLGNVPGGDAVSWLRPAELVEGGAVACRFVVDDVKQFDVRAGPLGCDRLADALAVLCQYRGLFYRVVPADQGFSGEYNYAGVFHFRLWWSAEWVEVLVDDRLPCVDRKPAGLHHGTLAQFWPALIEKAYAKLHGSYEALRQANISEILCELTGGLVETIHPSLSTNSEQLVTTLQEAVSHTILPVLVVSNSSDAAQMGMTEGNCYSVLAVDVVSLKGGGRTALVRLRRAPGRQQAAGAMRGNWARLDSAGWQSSGARDTDAWKVLVDAQAQGAFWVSVSEAARVFSAAHLVHFDADTCQSEVRLRDRQPLHTRCAPAAWRRGCTAGGCRNNTDTFHINPQMAISTGRDGAEVLIALCQQQGSRPLVVGFSVYRMPADATAAGCRLDNKFFRTNKAIFHSTYTNLRQVAQRVRFDKTGQYVLVPSTFDAGEEGSFTIKLYSTSQISMGPLDVTTTMNKNPILKAEKPLEKYRDIFAKFADENGSVNAYELQDLLHACLPNDYVKSCTSLDVCRRFVQVYQGAGAATGRITYNQFNDLLVSLKVWHEIFGHYAKNTSGVLKAERLRDALNDLGIKLSTESATLATQRYMRRDGTLRFGDFAACVLHLTASFNMFQRKDAAKAGQIKLTSAEVT